MKKLLIPVDLQNEPLETFRFAAHLAQKEPTEITLLNIVEFPVVPGNYMQPMDYIADLYQAQVDQQKEGLDKLAGHELLKGLNVKTNIISAALRGPGEEIGAFAREMKADLVIVFSKHRKGLQSLFAGSELLRIIRFCPAPLVVLSEGNLTQVNRLVFATDFSEMSAHAYTKVKAVAGWLGARLTLFCVNTLGDFSSQRQFTEKRNAFTQMIGSAELPEIILYNDWGPENGIIHFAEDHLADMIVFATHGRKGLGHLFMGSLTENVVQSTTFPLLVVNLGNE